MTDNPFWLAVGAFLTSPGFGGIAAILAAFGAYVGISVRVREDRAMAVEQAARDRALADDSDDRARWWEMAHWLWDNREKIDSAQALLMLENMATLSTTKGQALMLTMIGDVLIDSEPEGEAR